MIRAVLLSLCFTVFVAMTAQAADTLASPVATGGPIDLSGSASAPQTTPADSELCREANSVRVNFCPRALVDCKATLAQTDAKLIDQISRCPAIDDFDPFVGQSTVGSVPCCVAMGATGQ